MYKEVFLLFWLKFCVLECYTDKYILISLFLF